MKAKQEKRKNTIDAFVSAAMKLIEENGVDGVSTRKIADVTGYSYATLYNYFPNIGVLLQYCIYTEMNALNEYVDKFLKNKIDLSAQEKLLIMSESTARFFIEKPTAFELIFMIKLETLPPEEIRADLLSPVVIRKIREIINQLMNQYGTKEDEREATIQIFLNHLVGKLLYYFRRDIGKSSEMFLKEINKEILILIRGIKK